jgi:hypothetical protein
MHDVIALNATVAIAVAFIAGWDGDDICPKPRPWPWPPLFGNIIGGIGGVIAWLVFGKNFGGGGFLEVAGLGLLGGIFLSSLGRGVLSLGNRADVKTGI